MTTAVSIPPARRDGRPSLVVTWALIVAASLGIGLSCSSTQPIDRLTIVNRSAFDVEVQVSNAKRQSWQIAVTSGFEFVGPLAAAYVLTLAVAGPLVVRGTEAYIARTDPLVSRPSLRRAPSPIATIEDAGRSSASPVNEDAPDP